MHRKYNETHVAASAETIVSASQKTQLDRFSRCGKSQPFASTSHPAVCSQLLKNPKLRGWERLFISTLQKSPNPGRRQIKKLETIASLLGCKVAEGGEA
jgi:hypothetical protein